MVPMLPGVPFTGDHAGVILYQTLYRYGFASAAESVSADDGLILKNCRITNVSKMSAASQ